jgi:hypothetical protein
MNGSWLLLIVPFLIYYIIYPGGKKQWLRRKKEIDRFKGVQTEEDGESNTELLDD